MSVVGIDFLETSFRCGGEMNGVACAKKNGGGKIRKNLMNATDNNLRQRKPFQNRAHAIIGKLAIGLFKTVRVDLPVT